METAAAQLPDSDLLRRYVESSSQDVFAQVASRHGFVVKSARGTASIWLPVRKMRDRVLRIIASPSTATEPVMADVRGL
jgi:hypothetical protein